MTKLTYHTVEHNPHNKPIHHAVIWLHGLGADGSDFIPVVPMLQINPELAVRFIFPNAPKMPVTINGGFVMPAWYDILESTLDRKIDKKQIAQSSQWICELIDEQVNKGIPSENIIIAGFSQGGAVAYHTAFFGQRNLAGVLAISTYFATIDEVQPDGINTAMPIKIDHGEYDDVVPPVLAHKAKQALQDLGLQPTLSLFAATHSITAEQIAQIGIWMNQVFCKTSELKTSQ